MKVLKLIGAFLASLIVAHLLTSITGTQFVLADISGFGLDVSFADRLGATLHDVFGLFPMLFVLVGVTLLIAFIIAALGIRFIGGRRDWWYMAAGFTSVPGLMLVIKNTLGGTMYAPAGSTFGLLVIAVCGLAGGYTFARLTQKRGGLSEQHEEHDNQRRAGIADCRCSECC